MKHYSGIDYDHFLDDIRDMYAFSVDEAVLVELIANALDAKTTLIDIRIDPDQRLFEMTDNGVGMDAKGFEIYHNFSTSFKRKGQGIGFAGLGAKLALKIADRIVTETRQKEGGQSRQREGSFAAKSSAQVRPPERRSRAGSKHFLGASEWKFERKRRSALPVWYDIDERTLPHHGTRVRIYLKRAGHLLLQPDEVKQTLLTHYLPLLALPEFYESFKLYRRITVLVNGEVVEAAKPGGAGAIQFKHAILYRGRSRKPFALARFELHPQALPEPTQGVGISTFGKVIKRDYFKQYFKEMDRITGIIEVPELVECLTTSKCDFRKEGTAGKKYYRFSKIAQQEFRRWLESIQLIERTEPSANRDVQKLQRVVNLIVGEIPDLQQFYGFRTDRLSLVKDPGGEYTGAVPEQSPRAEEQEGEEREHLLQDALSEAMREGQSMEEGEAITAVKKLRSVKFGPTIHSVDAPERKEISWMEGDAVFINTAHPTYRKALEKKAVEYHNLFAAAIAMLREVPTAAEKLDLLEKFMSEWGKM